METGFQNEHLLPGQLGQFFVVLTFAGALLSTISYFFATTGNGTQKISWRKIARLGFFSNVIAVIGIAVCLFYIIYNHLFEYHYAWAHSSRSLPVHYIISCYWEGQEGSFWLWAFWQGVLGIILIGKARSWEDPVMTVLSLSQVLIASMLLGVTVLDVKIGSSPFILLRQAIEAPIFSRPDYLSYIKDGNGLNPLLQNYWMVIHPPMLFLGFASMVIPFAYAIAGLWCRKYQEWVAPAISYSLFAVMVLGAGIIMGAFWAYESLNFGGFWAWDPVENASLIPWLTMIGGLHVLIVYKNTGHAYMTAMILVLISYVLVLYASFLTRSGILGDTSVHAFTDMGMKWHLLIVVLIFLGLAVVMVILRWKHLPVSKKEEETYSREFWMFIGAVFMALSCFHLLAVTSIPVWNWIFGTKIAPPTEPIRHYNTLQAPVAAVVTLITGFTQFLKYRDTGIRQFLIRSAAYLISSVLLGGVISYLTGVYHLNNVFTILVMASVYTVLTNGWVLSDAFKGKIKLAGSAIAHIGFGMLLLGAIIAAGTSKIVSENRTGVGFGTEFAKASDPRENILLYKDKPVRMGEYLLTYSSDSIVKPDHFFGINFKKLDSKGKVVQQFTLKPNAQANKKMGLVANPDTKHFLFHDLYTHVTMAPIEQEATDETSSGHDADAENKKYDRPLIKEVSAGDTVRLREGYLYFKSLERTSKIHNIPLHPNDVALAATIKVASGGKTYQAAPVYLIRDGNVYDFAHKIEELGLKIRFSKVLPEDKKIELSIYQRPESERPYVVLRAINFPFINLFWAGTILMVIGFLISIRRRNKELKMA